jgi:hypothetical protein
VTIEGGTLEIDSSDDSLHSNDRLAIEGGDLTLTSGDDGIHADTSVTVSGGDLRIAKSYEGLESAAITIEGGNIHLVSSDDGINVAGGNDGSALGGRPGQGTFNASGNQYLAIDGGYISVDATGDGLDVNGAIAMAGGIVIVSGPTANNNGALDYDGGFKITGGTVIAAGSAGMAQAPDTTSTQNSLMVNFAASQPAGTLVSVQTEAGEEILTFAPARAYQSVVLSSPELEKGTTYVVYTGGTATGTAADGVYRGGQYTAGTKIATLTVSGVVTTSGATRMSFPAGGRR